MKTLTPVLIFFSACFLALTSHATTFNIPVGVDWVRQINTLAPGQGNIVYNTLQLNAGPGDTLYILGSSRTPIRLDDLRGDSLHPIVICNKDSRVTISKPNGGYYGMAFNGCRYIKVMGKKIQGIPYGIFITQIPGGSAFSINNFSSNFEVEGIEISKIYSAGIVAKTDPTCSNLLTYLTFVMYDLRLHHNYIHQVGNEGFYIGNTSYNEGNGNNISCTSPAYSGKVLPHKILGVKIYQNMVDSAGWDGIQVAASEQAEIFDNYVRNDSYGDVMNQMSGIFIGQPSQANVYRNTIINGKGSGIQCFGVGCNIYNNLIIHPGNSNTVRGYYNSSGQLVNASFTQGIYVNDKLCKDTTIQRLPYLVAHNTIVINRVYPVGSPYYTYAPQGINLNSISYINGSNIINNLVVIDSNTSQVLTSFINGIYASNSVPGYNTSYAPSFISANSKSVFGNNFFSNEMQAVNFNDWLSDNYALLNTSPAVDVATGSAVTNFPSLNSDFWMISRPQGAMPDFGAIETQPVICNTGYSGMMIVPNPIGLSANGSSDFYAMLNDTSDIQDIQVTLVSASLYGVSRDLSLSSNNVVDGKRVLGITGGQLPNDPGLYSLMVKSAGTVKAYAGLILLP